MMIDNSTVENETGKNCTILINCGKLDRTFEEGLGFPIKIKSLGLFSRFLAKNLGTNLTSMGVKTRILLLFLVVQIGSLGFSKAEDGLAEREEVEKRSRGEYRISPGFMLPAEYMVVPGNGDGNPQNLLPVEIVSALVPGETGQKDSPGAEKSPEKPEEASKGEDNSTDDITLALVPSSSDLEFRHDNSNYTAEPSVPNFTAQIFTLSYAGVKKPVLIVQPDVKRTKVDSVNLTETETTGTESEEKVAPVAGPTEVTSIPNFSIHFPLQTNSQFQIPRFNFTIPTLFLPGLVFTQNENVDKNTHELHVSIPHSDPTEYEQFPSSHIPSEFELIPHEMKTNDTEGKQEESPEVVFTEAQAVPINGPPEAPEFADSRLRDNATEVVSVKGDVMDSTPLKDNAHVDSLIIIPENATNISLLNFDSISYSPVNENGTESSPVKENAADNSPIKENTENITVVKNNAIESTPVKANITESGPVKNTVTESSPVKINPTGSTSVNKNSTDISSFNTNVAVTNSIKEKYKPNPIIEKVVTSSSSTDDWKNPSRKGKPIEAKLERIKEKVASMTQAMKEGQSPVALNGGMSAGISPVPPSAGHSPVPLSAGHSPVPLSASQSPLPLSASPDHVPLNVAMSAGRPVPFPPNARPLHNLLHPNGTGSKWKLPTLDQLYNRWFGTGRMDNDECAGARADFTDDDDQDDPTLCGSEGLCGVTCNRLGFWAGKCVDDSSSCVCLLKQRPEFGLKLEYFIDQRARSSEYLYPAFGFCHSSACRVNCEIAGYVTGLCDSTCFCGMPWAEKMSSK